MTTDNYCFYLQNRLIQTSQTGGQWYSDPSPFSIPRINWLIHLLGGATVWPYAGISVFPEKGSAVFWHNVRASGIPDIFTRHAACPVLLGQGSLIKLLWDSIGLHYPLDGVTNPKYKLLHFIQLTKFN